ncbi:hypothetical protein [Halorubrum sp. AS12]|uniref:hypothetical protein n=1 Tax=Halorubrum sp. AS12 TaxID=3409687 RepID=UPI003DA7864B
MTGVLLENLPIIGIIASGFYLLLIVYYFSFREKFFKKKSASEEEKEVVREALTMMVKEEEFDEDVGEVLQSAKDLEDSGYKITIEIERHPNNSEEEE